MSYLVFCRVVSSSFRVSDSFSSLSVVSVTSARSSDSSCMYFSRFARTSSFWRTSSSISVSLKLRSSFSAVIDASCSFFSPSSVLNSRSAFSIRSTRASAFCFSVSAAPTSILAFVIASLASSSRDLFPSMASCPVRTSSSSPAIFSSLSAISFLSFSSISSETFSSLSISVISRCHFSSLLLKSASVISAAFISFSLAMRAICISLNFSSS